MISNFFDTCFWPINTPNSRIIFSVIVIFLIPFSSLLFPLFPNSIDSLMLLLVVTRILQTR